MDSTKSFLEDFKSGVRDLAEISRDSIEFFSQLANDNVDLAPQIVDIIEDAILEVCYSMTSYFI